MQDGRKMGEYADAEIDRMLAVDDYMLDRIGRAYSHQPKPKPQPKARDLRRLAGKLNALTTKPNEKG